MDIIQVDGQTALFYQPVLDQEPWTPVIELDVRGRTLSARVVPPSDFAIPREVWLRYVRQFEIPHLTADAANRLLQEIAPLAERIMNDWTSEPRITGSSDYVAILGPDAASAERQLEERLSELHAECEMGCRDGDLITVFDVNACTTGDEADEYGITPDTPDERLLEIAEEITQELTDHVSASGVAVSPGLVDYLVDLRNELREE